MKAEEIRLHFQKLNEQRVELALIDDLAKLIVKAETSQSAATVSKNKAIEQYKNADAIFKSVIAQSAKAMAQAKDLGAPEAVSRIQNFMAIADNKGATATKAISALGSI